MNETVTIYRMNPAEDYLVFGDELTEGMWVLADDPQMRRPHGKNEDDRLRAQRFRRVTRLRREPGLVVFVAEWVDGYQEMHRYSANYGWIAKKDVTPDAAEVGDDS